MLDYYSSCILECYYFIWIWYLLFWYLLIGFLFFVISFALSYRIRFYLRTVYQLHWAFRWVWILSWVSLRALRTQMAPLHLLVCSRLQDPLIYSSIDLILTGLWVSRKTKWRNPYLHNNNWWALWEMILLTLLDPLVVYSSIDNGLKSLEE